MTVTQEASPKRESLHIIDDRTGSYYSIPIVNNAINASDFKKVTAPEDKAYPANQTENGLRVYDPGYSNTAVSHSKITYIDGLKGTIQYRGYSINDIVGRKTFIDTAHLLIWGHWPSAAEAETLQQRLDQVPVPQDFVFNVIKSFPYVFPKLTLLRVLLANLQQTRWFPYGNGNRRSISAPVQ